jgi:large subunit ribosomal protein L2
MKILKPITPSNRHRTLILRKHLWKKNGIKKLIIGIHKKSGHNNKGRITIYNRGGGHKRKYRKIDLKRSLIKKKAIVIRLEYDPNRTANIALICYKNGILSYIIAPKDIKIGNIIETGIKVPTKIGNSLIIKNILIGTIIHNIELIPGKGGQLARAAGTYALLINKKNNGYAMLRLSSGEIRMISILCMATIGVVSNIKHNNKVNGKAGHSRWVNRKPVVRGVAMNPVDHPHGGRTKGGRPSVTPWGRITKGMHTVKHYNKLIIHRRN